MRDDYKFSRCQYFPLAYYSGQDTITYGSPFRYKTKKFFNHFCIPEDETYISADVQKEFK